jgi:hypothetical protein
MPPGIDKHAVMQASLLATNRVSMLSKWLYSIPGHTVASKAAAYRVPDIHCRTAGLQISVVHQAAVLTTQPPPGDIPGQMMSAPVSEMVSAVA